MSNLQSGNILLRTVQFEDKVEMTRLANNFNVWSNLKDYIPYPYTDKDADYFIKLVLNENPRVNFCIEFCGKFAGLIGLVPLKDVYCKSAEIGYWIGEPYWNNKIATRAVELITSYGVNDLNFFRIQAGVFEYNRASMRVLEKCNYKREGIFCKAVWKKNQLWDEHKFAFLRE